jgi:hypothetical protein
MSNRITLMGVSLKQSLNCGHEVIGAKSPYKSGYLHTRIIFDIRLITVICQCDCVVALVLQSSFFNLKNDRQRLSHHILTRTGRLPLLIW